MSRTLDGYRIAVIGNAGGGNSTLARRLSADLGLRHVEIDRLLWRSNWTPMPVETYLADHARAIAAESWIIDGLGRRESIAERLNRATVIILVDMPIWMHFWLAAEWQFAWHQSQLDHPPAGADAPPPTHVLFRTIFEVDRDWMPEVRALVQQEHHRGKCLIKIDDMDALKACTGETIVTRSAECGEVAKAADGGPGR